VSAPERLLGHPVALLGFDARETFVPPARSWTTRRREDFLLRPEVEKPLSVDTWAWPSIFGDGFTDRDRPTELPEMPAWRGASQTLWDDLASMDEALRAVPRSSYCRIAVAWFLEAADTQPPPYIVEISPGRIESTWTLLGLDVADGWLLSGLSNCGYDTSERAIFRRDWAGQLNEHHLFESLPIARAFRDATNVRVPEHAPFFVFALFRIDGDEPSTTGG